MKRAYALAVVLGATLPIPARAQTTPVPADALAAVPSLRADTDHVLFGALWKRGILSPRDRSLVTVAAMVAGDHADELRFHLARALDNGVTPVEINGTITHLAYYAGWPSATAAEKVARDVYAQRGIGADKLSADGKPPVAIDEAADAKRAAGVQANVGPMSPGLAEFTNTVLFDDVWRRPDLTPRDRSLVTIKALIVTGQTAQLTFHTGFGLKNGLTKPEIGETLTQLVFYAGWPKAFSALPFVQKAFDTPAK